MSGIRKVLIADDHPVIVTALRFCLADILPEAEFTEVRTLADGYLAAKASNFSLAVVDIYLEGSASFELIRELRDRSPGIRIVAISASDDPATIERVISSGSNAFISKRHDPAAIKSTVQAVMEGRLDLRQAPEDQPLVSTQSETVSTIAVENLSPDLQNMDTRLFSELSNKLSKREIQIVKLICEGKTNVEIANTLFLSVGTVKNYVSRIFDKLEVTSRTQAIISLLNVIS